MKRILGYFLAILAVLLVLNLAIVPLIEPSLIYFPMAEIERTPHSIGLEYEDIYLETADNKKINGWFIENKASNKVILHFHGNGGNLSHRVSLIKLLHHLPVNVFVIDYHGYGRSEGTPSEQNLYLDAKAAYDFLIKQKKFSPAHILVMGSSLGGAVAAHLAAQEEVGGLILQRAFTSARAMASRMNPLYQRPIVWIRSDFNTLEKIDKILAPKLIVHSKEDEMVPYTMAVALYKNAAEPKKLVLLEKGKHNDLMTAPEYINNLRKILKLR